MGALQGTVLVESLQREIGIKGKEQSEILPPSAVMESLHQSVQCSLLSWEKSANSLGVGLKKRIMEHSETC
jgi:hypothetical protein